MSNKLIIILSLSILVFALFSCINTVEEEVTEEILQAMKPDLRPESSRHHDKRVRSWTAGSELSVQELSGRVVNWNIYVVYAGTTEGVVLASFTTFQDEIFSFSLDSSLFPWLKRGVKYDVLVDPMYNKQYALFLDVEAI